MQGFCEHITPRWGSTRLSDVNHSAVQAWVSELSATKAPATTRKVHRVLSLILTAAVKDERLVRNPAAGVSLPRVDAKERMYLTHQEVHQLAEACGPYRLVVLFLAYTGVRFGEMAALRIHRIDLMRRRAAITESVTLVRGVQTWGTPKGHERREVPIPRFLAEELPAHVAGRDDGQLAFSGIKGGALRAQVFRELCSRAPLPSWVLAACIRTRCAIPPRRWQSRPAPTSRSCSRCSAISQRP